MSGDGVLEGILEVVGLVVAGPVVGEGVGRCDICTDQVIRLLGLMRIDLLFKELELLWIGWNMERDMFDCCIFPSFFCLTCLPIWHSWHFACWMILQNRDMHDNLDYYPDLISLVYENLSPVPHIRIAFMADATQDKWFSTLTCFSLPTHIDDNCRDLALLAHSVKDLIETWQDLSDSHEEARTLTKRLEVTNIRCSL